MTNYEKEKMQRVLLPHGARRTDRMPRLERGRHSRCRNVPSGDGKWKIPAISTSGPHTRRDLELGPVARGAVARQVAVNMVGGETHKR